MCVVIEMTVPAKENLAQTNSRENAYILSSCRKQVGKWNASQLKLGPEGLPTKPSNREDWKSWACCVSTQQLTTRKVMLFQCLNREKLNSNESSCECNNSHFFLAKKPSQLHTPTIFGENLKNQPIKKM